MSRKTQIIKNINILGTIILSVELKSILNGGETRDKTLNISFTID